MSLPYSRNTSSREELAPSLTELKAGVYHRSDSSVAIALPTLEETREEEYSETQ
jgi:hypothetical protein